MSAVFEPIYTEKGKVSSAPKRVFPSNLSAIEREQRPRAALPGRMGITIWAISHDKVV